MFFVSCNEQLKLITMVLKCFVDDSEMLFNNCEKLPNDFEMSLFYDLFDDLSSRLNKSVRDGTYKGGLSQNDSNTFLDH